jgi:predicted RND superfamily exporter protein
MNMTVTKEITSLKERYFDFVTQHPKRVLISSLLLIIAMGVGLKNVQKDASVDAFVPSDHPAALARDRAAELFGLEDPIVLGIVADGGQSAFTPELIGALKNIQNQVRLLDNVKKNALISILTESAISGDNGDLIVEPIVAKGNLSQGVASQALARVRSMPMMDGLLASKNGDTLTLIVPVNDADHATETYREVLAIAAAHTPENARVHVSGVASMNGRLGQMVNRDSRLFIPLAVITVLSIIFIALRDFRGLPGPLMIIAGSVVITVGLMGWLDARYYLITTALPVIIMAIAIADSLHISTIFLDKCRLSSHKSRRENVRETLRQTYLPITLTTVTTVAGFTGLAIGSSMKPIVEFGWFAAAGVIAAWILSMSALPAVILLTKLGARPQSQLVKNSSVNKAIDRLTQNAFNHPIITSSSLTLVLAILAYFAVQARFDYERQRYFQPHEDVRIADITLNERLQGLNFLDVVVSGNKAGDLMTPAAMRAVADLQLQLNSQPFVVKSTSITDYMALMHRVLTDAPQGELPIAKNAPEQYMFLYESAGDPGDFNEEIDFSYQHLLIRTQLSTDRFSAVSPTVAKFEEIAQYWSQETGLEASVSGRVAVNTGWMALLEVSHFTGLGLAVLFVFFASAFAFRSFWTALLSLVPILTGVLFTYAVMGLLKIDIAPATSMIAAISTGLGVDFAIHLISGIRQGLQNGLSLRAAFSGHYIIIARACVFSGLALAVGLAVMLFSSTPPLQWFGVLVASATIGSLIGAVIIIPACYALFAPTPFFISLKGNAR